MASKEKELPKMTVTAVTSFEINLAEDVLAEDFQSVCVHRLQEAQSAFSHTFPDGTVVTVTYIKLGAYVGRLADYVVG